MDPGVAAGGECRHAVGKSREPRFARLGGRAPAPKASDANWRRSGDYGNEAPDLEPRPGGSQDPPAEFSPAADSGCKSRRKEESDCGVLGYAAGSEPTQQRRVAPEAVDRGFGGGLTCTTRRLYSRAAEPQPIRADRREHRQGVIMKKETAILVVLVAALVAFAAGRWSTHAGPRGDGDAAAAHPAEVAVAPTGEASASGIPATMPVKGLDTALVTIVEISDFQCPFCSRVGPTVKQLVEAYPQDVRVVWANNPLPFHDKAKPAAKAAMAAHRQGKFWEMHDKLFANQGALSEENYRKWAGEIGLDLAKFAADMTDAAIEKQIDREQKVANALGARGTPAFFINGKLLSGAQPYDAFKREVDAALAGAKKLAGTQSGLALMEAAFAERDATLGANVVKFFFKGEEPAAVAERRPNEEAEAEDSGPAKPPADSYEVWKVPVDVKTDSIRGDNEDRKSVV